ncbi:uncharacterized protein TRIADDRAFT_62145 [Trichoplax adhaerens]|uniref:Major facilitator superfamily (MFS) profile domain-containing protein n=1 Tax=Trichoplax adhaerens TaxID=10228 RepID=B3SCY9_TRIAD|nr:hypothetical protein TRIADDRAFT_62145 [Trichoplax adhaerens]EDV19402.1 hypothetical protein TRIADDRAFT_62145 [Trichoplax adhaerens]|eukprot:XP_002118091.1 hypothetical protein TRIADDRAFT_62145 [Trichoplax adhaerens]
MDAVEKKGSDDDHLQKFTIADVIEHIGFGPFQIRSLFVIGFIWPRLPKTAKLILTSMIRFSMLSILGPLLACDWGITKLEEALINALSFAGDILGSIYFGWFCDRYGRKLGVIFGILSTSYMSMISGLSSGIEMMLLLRFACGFTEGATIQCVTMVIEIVPAKARAKTIASLRTLVESPRYLLLHGFYKEASNIMKNAAKLNNKPAPEGKLVASVEV